MSDHMEGSSSQKDQKEQPNKDQANILHASPSVQLSPIERKIAELSSPKVARLHAHVVVTPNPTETDLIRISSDIGLTTEDVGLFYALMRSAEITENQSTSSRETEEDDFDRDTLFSKLKAIFKKTLHPSDDALQQLAIDYRRSVDYLRVFYREEQIRHSHEELQEKLRAKRAKKRLAEDTENEGASSSTESQPPKRPFTDRTEVDNRRQDVQNFQNVLDRENQEKERAEAERAQLQKKQLLTQVEEGDSDIGSIIQSLSAENLVFEDALDKAESAKEAEDIVKDIQRTKDLLHGYQEALAEREKLKNQLKAETQLNKQLQEIYDSAQRANAGEQNEGVESESKVDKRAKDYWKKTHIYFGSKRDRTRWNYFTLKGALSSMRREIAKVEGSLESAKSRTRKDKREIEELESQLEAAKKRCDHIQKMFESIQQAVAGERKEVVENNLEDEIEEVRNVVEALIQHVDESAKKAEEEESDEDLSEEL